MTTTPASGGRWRRWRRRRAPSPPVVRHRGQGQAWPPIVVVPVNVVGTWRVDCQECGTIGRASRTRATKKAVRHNRNTHEGRGTIDVFGYS